MSRHALTFHLISLALLAIAGVMLMIGMGPRWVAGLVVLSAFAATGLGIVLAFFDGSKR